MIELRLNESVLLTIVRPRPIWHLILTKLVQITCQTNQFSIDTNLDHIGTLNMFDFGQLLTLTYLCNVFAHIKRIKIAPRCY